MNSFDVSPTLAVPRPKKKRVVVLDDDMGILRAVERLLSRAGLIVTTTMDPRRAMDLVVAGGVDAIVSDLHMPEMGGNAVLALLAKSAPRTARLLVTSESDFAAVATASVPFTIDAFLSKQDLSVRLVPTLEALFAGRDRE